MSTGNLPMSDKLYGRGYLLYHKLFGLEPIDEPYNHSEPMPKCHNIVTVGAVLLEGWVSA